MPDRTMTRAEWRIYWRAWRVAWRDRRPEPEGYPLWAERGHSRDSAALWLTSAGQRRSRGNASGARVLLRWAAEDRCAMGV